MDYFTCSFGRKINFLKCGDNEGPVATFVATLVIALDNADPIGMKEEKKNAKKECKVKSI